MESWPGGTCREILRKLEVFFLSASLIYIRLPYLSSVNILPPPLPLPLGKTPSYSRPCIIISKQYKNVITKYFF